MIEHIPIWMYIGFAIVAIAVFINISGLWNDKCPICKSNRLRIERHNKMLGIQISKRVSIGMDYPFQNIKHTVYKCPTCKRLFKYNEDDKLIEIH